MRDLERAVNNLLPQVGTSDFASFFKGYTGAYAWEAPEAYWSESFAPRPPTTRTSPTEGSA
jgi:hypothetical protein